MSRGLLPGAAARDFGGLSDELKVARLQGRRMHAHKGYMVQCIPLKLRALRLNSFSL